MDWHRLGLFFSAWSSAIDGKHSLYIEERRGQWFLYFAVARSKGLMLAEAHAQECLTADDLAAFPNVEQSAQSLAQKMLAAFHEPA